MENVIYKQNRQSEMMKIYLFFVAISFMGFASLAVSLLSDKRMTLLFVLPFIAVFLFVYLSFREFIKYGADIEINSKNFIINNKVFNFASLSEVGQCTNRHLIYFIFNENEKISKIVGFNRFTHKEMLILNDKTRFIETIKKLTNASA